MPYEYDNDLLRQGLICLRAGEFSSARRYLERALEMADDWETRARANFYLSQVTDDPAEKRNFLENTLAIEPSNGEARRALAILDGKLQPSQIVDANASPAPVSAEREVRAERFTCPKCGGRMTFAPDGFSLTCEFCTRSQILSQRPAAQEQDFMLAMATGQGQRAPVAVQTAHCAGCGADFILPPTQKTAICAYCGSAHVLRGDERQLLEPDSLLPFRFARREAVRRLVDWVQQNKIQPQGKVQPPRGIYLPVWTFDIGGNFPWQGKIYRNKRWLELAEVEPVFYNDIALPAGKTSPNLMKKLLRGCDFSQAAAYDPRYLSGWAAELFDAPLASASLLARQMAVERSRENILHKRGSLRDFTYSSSQLSILSFRLTLIPVWRTEISLEENSFPLFINGFSGEVLGEAPARGALAWLEKLLG
ncbi:MAG: hypothetical protein OHK0031_04930 [Anaerolineales bacterium]